jgi:predicted heme/steroid binding protein
MSSLSKSYFHDILAKAKLDVADIVTFKTVNNSNVDTDKFLVIENDEVKYRTGEQLLADIGVIGLNMSTIVAPLYFTNINNTPTLFITKADISTNGYLSYTDWNIFYNKQPFITPGLTSEYWRGDKTWQTLNTGVVPENGNLYFTTLRAREALTVSAPLLYNNITGLFSISQSNSTTNGYLSSTDWSTFNLKEPSITAGTIAQYWRGDKSWQILDTSIVPENTNLYYTQGRFDLALAGKSTTNLAEGLNLYYTNERARASITLTTTGSSGVASYFSDSGILNIPNYTLAGLGGVPLTRTITINGTTYDLSANRTWTIVAGVSSVIGTSPIVATSVDGVVTISIPQSTTGVDGYLSHLDWTNFNSKEPGITSGTSLQYWRGDKTWQTLNTTVVPEGTNLYYTDDRARSSISLTTTGSNGAATYSSISGILNVPVYTLSGLGGVPTSRTITIDGVTHDLSINRTWNVLPALGTAGQILAKINGTSYNTEWIDNYTSSVKHLVKLSEAMTIGTAVYVSSADGTNMIVSKASNVGESTSSKTMGLIAFSGSTNAHGFLITEGLLSGINTSLANAGDPVWLGVNGQLLFGLANKPQAPAHMVFLGIVTRVQQNNGEIFVKVQNGFELQELHNVSLNSTLNNQILVYESSTSLWKAKSIPTILGYTPVSTTSNLTNSYIPKASGATSLINSNISDDGTTIKLNSNARITGNLQIDGNFVVGGTTTTVGAINLSVSDNMIYLNNAIETNITNAVGNGTTITYTADNNYVAGMTVTITGVDPIAFNLTNQTIVSANATSFTINSTLTPTYISGGTARAKSNANPDLGWAAGYNDGTYHHTGIFRDATDGVYKFFQGYLPEPDISPFIDTSDPSFQLAQVQASKFIGPLQGNADTVTNGVYTSRTLTINGVTYDLSANRSWTIVAGVSSVTASSPLSATTGSTPIISISQATSTTDGYLSSTDWITFNNKQNAITLTTTGNSGSATYLAGTLNIPTYTLVGLGGVPTTRTITINGTPFDLSLDRSWSVGTVTSVAALTLGTSGTDLSSSVANGTTTPVITLNVPTASATNRGVLSSTDWSTFNGKQNALGYTPVNQTTTLTINGVSYDLSANRSWTVAAGVTGSGVANQLSYWSGTNAITSSANYTFNPTPTASTGLGRSLYLSPTITAAANNDVLSGYDINPTFINGAYTGVINYGLRVLNGNTYFYNPTVGANVFTVQGSTGSLFVVSDIITGNLLQVNDISGLPLMGVNANGALYMYSASATGISTSPYTIYTLDETTGTAAYFDYRVTNTVNNGWRAGTVMAVWNPTTNVVEFTDTSTADLTATTSGLSWSVAVTGTSVQLSAIITSGTWNIKIGARVI